MNLPSVKVIYDYKKMLSVYWSHQLSIQVYISSNISTPLKNLIIFSTSQCPYVTLDIVFLSAVPLLGQSYRQCFIVSLCFLHVGCWLFLDINCLWVSLVCPIRILLSLTSYCLQLLWEFSHSLMCGLMKCSLEFLALLIVK